MKVTRFEKLKSLRADLCEREKNNLIKMQHQQWLLDQVKELKKISECKDCTIDTIKIKIDQILLQISDLGSKK